MAFEKKTFIDRAEILRNAVVQIRLAAEFLEDGNLLHHHFVRFTLVPGDDTLARFAEINTILVSKNIVAIPVGQINRVKAVTDVLWTPAVIAAYQASLPPVEGVI